MEAERKMAVKVRMEKGREILAVKGRMGIWEAEGMSWVPLVEMGRVLYRGGDRTGVGPG